MISSDAKCPFQQRSRQSAVISNTVLPYGVRVVRRVQIRNACKLCFFSSSNYSQSRFQNVDHQSCLKISVIYYRQLRCPETIWYTVLDPPGRWDCFWVISDVTLFTRPVSEFRQRRTVRTVRAVRTCSKTSQCEQRRIAALDALHAGRPAATPGRIHNGRIHKHIFAHREECRQRKTPFAFLSLQHRFGLIRVNVSHPFSSSSLISHRVHHSLHCTHLRLRQTTRECAYLWSIPGVCEILTWGCGISHSSGHSWPFTSSLWDSAGPRERSFWGTLAVNLAVSSAAVIVPRNAGQIQGVVFHHQKFQVINTLTKCGPSRNVWAIRVISLDHSAKV